MNKLIIFISSSILLLCTGCEKEWQQNRFSISGITIDSTSESKIYLNFHLFYYSDSTKGYYISQGIEKGLNGSQENIDQINIDGMDQKISKQEIDSMNIYNRNFQSFEDFKYHFNLKHRNTIGQRLTSGIEVNVDPVVLKELAEKKGQIYIVMGTASKKDTIFSTW